MKQHLVKVQSLYKEKDEGLEQAKSDLKKISLEFDQSKLSNQTLQASNELMKTSLVEFDVLKQKNTECLLNYILCLSQLESTRAELEQERKDSNSQSADSTPVRNKIYKQNTLPYNQIQSPFHMHQGQYSGGRISSGMYP